MLRKQKKRKNRASKSYPKAGYDDEESRKNYKKRKRELRESF